MSPRQYACTLNGIVLGTSHIASELASILDNKARGKIKRANSLSNGSSFDQTNSAI